MEQAPQDAARRAAGARGRIRGLASRRLRVGAVAAIFLAAGFITWLVLDRDSGGVSSAPQTVRASPSSSDAEIAPTVFSLAGLAKLAGSTSTPLYWAGPRPGKRYEVTRTAAGTIYLRYLSTGVRPGSRIPALTIVTYAIPNAFSKVRAAARGKGTMSIPLPGGGLAVLDVSRPTNIHFAYPGEQAQVEVYAPRAGLARRLVASGAVRPLG